MVNQSFGTGRLLKQIIEEQRQAARRDPRIANLKKT